ncbi:hypothetical protein GCHA_1716 [Paraglaciecola chathamensis S18K6]|uniref:Uncharacterized protein n=2 Tax=Paraglaciecola chathamensis TaxID=368405 RepID=A0ABQ0I4K2_9ALTE|nr:hypothetical protein GAGA_1345 [Paraglaciecola agarilytica NO2]GAC09667.1 hypothetical protein GCHA_1716 [Paraglaciecola chathamensis S18K6]
MRLLQRVLPIAADPNALQAQHKHLIFLRAKYLDEAYSN